MSQVTLYRAFPQAVQTVDSVCKGAQQRWGLGSAHLLLSKPHGLVWVCPLEEGSIV